MKNGAQLLVECLEAQGVTHVFAIPGAKIDAVFNALLDSSIRVIVCRHEQNAAFMAAAQGRLTGKPGVVLVTSGPGISNLATGLLTATTEGDPVIAIGGNVARNMRYKAAHQNADNLKLMEAVTKARMGFSVVDSIPEIIANAFRIAAQPHAGAVFLSLPQDVGLEATTLVAPKPSATIQLGSANAALIKQAAQRINQAQTPVLLLGQESSREINSVAIQTFIKQSQIPVISTFQAAGVVTRELLPYFVGRVGLFANQPGDKLIEQADYVITIGFNPGEYDPEMWNDDARKPIIHINYDIADIRHAYTPDIELCGDIALTLQSLESHIIPHTSTDYRRLFQDIEDKIAEGESHQAMPIHPLRFIDALRTILDDDAIVAVDIGSNYMWMARYFLSYKPHHLLFSNGQQTLGVALPWAMGAKFVYPNKTIVSISGDGGFLFSAMELETAVREKLHIVHFIWVDGSYDMVKEQQLMKYQRESAVKLGAIDVVKFAESFGARGYKVTQADQLVSTIQAALSGEGPVLVEIPIDYQDNPSLFATVAKQLH